MELKDKPKLEVGMYVRTIEGIYQLPKEGDKLQEHLEYYNDFYVNGDWFEKASYNIIDLIEVGDVVEYKKGNYTVKSDVFLDEDTNELVVDDLIDLKPIDEIKIVRILTKEQYENNAYKVNN